MNRDLEKLSIIYEATVIEENPDTIWINDHPISYDDDYRIVSAILNEKGEFVSTNDREGHVSLIEDMAGVEDLEEVSMLDHIKTNVKDISSFRRLNKPRVRMWVDHKIFSFWESTVPKYYDAAVFNLMKTYGQDPKSYKYDLNIYQGEYISYDDYVNREVDPAKLQIQARERGIDQRMLADYQLGVLGKRDVPEWQRSQGG